MDFRSTELSNEEHTQPTNFIHKIIEEDLDADKANALFS